ncbi:galactoside 2-alpha-L-fucosyltransferase 2 isoform X2 [Eurytemora carolleeae]|uniref:galactoside 2-alpha-L-fucosyltransferase 2 isoform X2 n=1 Tax=Eurytemora carolleeae TaxID=1294199 RepID=UPI000C78B328|nr:galactoside 2-alpha-L-fucosyltransferase 2 isoform X2 [Eurytemora carolleeae]|eukprot:XP_023324540.1 galactoside 2-alpha-L-fucosyltransferase 2-like isoform X2 [Eurytemora affinis]
MNMTRQNFFIFILICLLVFQHLFMHLQSPDTMETQSTMLYDKFECNIQQGNKCLYGAKSFFSLCSGPPEQLICKDQISSVLFSDCNGRLGNVMMTYATLLFFSKYGFSALLNEYQENVLNNAFQSDAFSIKKEILKKPPTHNVYSINEHGEYIYDEFLENMESKRYNLLLDIGVYPLNFGLFYQIRDELKKHFQFHPEIMKSAKDAINQSTWEIRKNYDDKAIVYVGVHARRGDYLNLKKPEFQDFMADDDVWRQYFSYCFSLIRNRVDHSGNKTIFLMTSEDTDWLKNNFGSEPDVAYPGYYGVEDLPGEKMPARDLYLFTQCDHMIRSYGTFGMWGGFWSTGIVLYPYTGRSIEEEHISAHVNSSNWEPIDINRFIKPKPTIK